MLTRYIIEKIWPEFQGLMPETQTSNFSFPMMLFLGIMYQGVLSDFQESLKIPGQIAERLEALMDRAFVLRGKATVKQKGFPVVAFHRELLEFVLCTFEYLSVMRGHMDMLALTQVLGGVFEEAVGLVSDGEADSWEVRDHILHLRACFTRIVTIKRTDFMAK